MLAQGLGQDPCRVVGPAPGRVGHDQGDGLAGITRRQDRRAGQQGAKGQAGLHQIASYRHVYLYSCSESKSWGCRYSGLRPIQAKKYGFLATIRSDARWPQRRAPTRADRRHPFGFPSAGRPARSPPHHVRFLHLLRAAAFPGQGAHPALAVGPDPVHHRGRLHGDDAAGTADHAGLHDQPGGLRGGGVRLFLVCGHFWACWRRRISTASTAATCCWRSTPCSRCPTWSARWPPTTMPC